MKLEGAKGVRSELNVTPLIDVVLVLLIIFMVVVPLREARFRVVVPDTEPTPSQAPVEAALLVFVEATGVATLNGEQVTDGELAEQLGAELVGRATKVVFFDAAADAGYGRAIEVMDLCKAAGAAHLGMLEPEGTGP